MRVSATCVVSMGNYFYFYCTFKKKKKLETSHEMVLTENKKMMTCKEIEKSDKASYYKCD